MADIAASAEKDRASTTKIIAISLLIAFGICVAILLVCSFVFSINYSDKTSSVTNNWFDLLKTCVISLGAMLTTVIGYYFGQRGYEKVQEELIKKKQEVEAGKADTSILMEALNDKTQTDAELSALVNMKSSDPDELDPNLIPKKG